MVIELMWEKKIDLVINDSIKPNNFSKISFDGNNSLIIEGMAFSDQDILNFIANLNAKSLIDQASLAAMKVQTGESSSGSNNKKGFIINCKLKEI